MKETDVLIIGSGPAACSAALYTTRAGLKTIMLGGKNFGGQLVQTNDIENYAGFIEPVGGFELMDKMHKQCARLGAEMLKETAVSVKREGNKLLTALEGGEVVSSYAVLAATGATARWLNVEGENQFKNHGLSACATCDGFFYRGKTVAIIGGGNTAFEDALFLTNFCQKVYLIHRRAGFRADEVTVNKAKNNPKIEFIIPAVTTKLLGDKTLTGIELQNPETKETKTLEVQGVFVAIGSIPQTKFLADSGVKLAESGHVIVDAKHRTNIEGLFAAGDCQDPVYRQAIVAAGSGAKAAIEIINYVNQIK